jgi:hypothetical protein
MPLLSKGDLLPQLVDAEQLLVVISQFPPS